MFPREFEVPMLRKRQAAQATSTLTSSSDSAAAAAAAKTASTSSSSSSTTKPADIAITTDGPNGLTTIFSIISPPPFTATVTTPYAAPGVNATAPPPTPTPTPLSPTTTTTSSTTTSYRDAAEEAVASAQAFGIPKNQLTSCQINGTWPHASPFCSPDQNQGLWVGYTYAITWNPALFAQNASNVAQLTYTNDSEGIMWTSDPVSNVQGYVDVKIERDWLRGANGINTWLGQNATLSLISTPIGADNETKVGPLISIIVDPKTVPLVPVPKPSHKYGLEIGLPVGVAALVILFFSICYGIRRNGNHHRSALGGAKDYMSRRNRRRGRPDIALDEYGSGDQVDQYTDQPLKGSGEGNAFRDEVARQRAEDEQSLRRFPTSF